MTHEEYINEVRNLAVARVTDEPVRQRLLLAKLVYGAGNIGTRGVCYFRAWRNGTSHDFIEICAASEQGPLQIAGTTLHELAHVIAGSEAGHNRHWKDACRTLGLQHPEAANQQYLTEDFESELQVAIAALSNPVDGTPVFSEVRNPFGRAGTLKVRPCPVGIGSRGGRSRGPGSGSRLRLYVCRCGVKVRVASNEFRATCLRCNSTFENRV